MKDGVRFVFVCRFISSACLPVSFSQLLFCPLRPPVTHSLLYSTKEVCIMTTSVDLGNAHEDFNNVYDCLSCFFICLTPSTFPSLTPSLSPTPSHSPYLLLPHSHSLHLLLPHSPPLSLSSSLPRNSLCLIIPTVAPACYCFYSFLPLLLSHRKFAIMRSYIPPSYPHQFDIPPTKAQSDVINTVINVVCFSCTHHCLPPHVMSQVDNVNGRWIMHKILKVNLS